MRVGILCAVAVLLLLSGSLQGEPDGVTLQKTDGRVDILVGGKPFTSYYHAPDLPRPFFHPLRAADGRIVTRGYPMIQAEGEERDKDHPHHRSLWFTFGDVSGVDYWAEGAKVQGRIVHRSVDTIESAGNKGVLAVTMDWLDNNGQRTVVQKQRAVFHGDSSSRYIDFEIQLEAAGKEVKIGDTKEGMFAIRLATPLKERTGAVILNSNGAVSEKNCWGKSAEWVDYSGDLGGSKVGVTIMDHPRSFRHPTTWHVRGYGLFAANPFGLRDFTADKNQDGSHMLRTGEKVVFRYRVWIHPGAGEKTRLDEEYRKYVREVQ